MKLKTLKDLYDLSDFESDGSKAGVKISAQDLRDAAREWTKRPFMVLCPEAEGIGAGKVMGIQNAFIKHFFNLEK